MDATIVFLFHFKIILNYIKLKKLKFNPPKKRKLLEFTLDFFFLNFLGQKMAEFCQKKKRWMPPQTPNKLPVKKSGTEKGRGGGGQGGKEGRN